MSPVAVAADKRFRRAHVKPTRARRGLRVFMGRAVLFVLIAVPALYLARRGIVMVAHTRVLQVDHIVVHGNERLSNGEVLAVLSGLRGESLIWTDLNRWRLRLLSSPWVQDAALRRRLPSTVEVIVSERQPIGIGRIGGHGYLIDDRGTVIDAYGPQYAEFDLPIIDGLSEADGAGAPGNEARAQLAARVLAAVRPNPAISGRVSQIDVHDVHNAAVILSGDAAVLQLGEQQFLGRLQSYLELAQALRERVADIDSVDLRFEGRVYVRPVEKTKAGRLVRRTRR